MAKYFMTLVIDVDDALVPYAIHQGKGSAHGFEQSIRDKLNAEYQNHQLRAHGKLDGEYPPLCPQVDIKLAEACKLNDRMEFHKRFVFGK